MDFGKALRKAQDLKFVRSAQLAEQLGVSRQQVHKWRTKKDARLSLAVRLAKELDIHVMDFLELANEDS